MVKYSYDSFWKAFFLSTIIFLVGLNLGVFIENSGLDEIERAVIASEVELYDSNIRSSIIQNYNQSCDTSIENTFLIADKIYGEVQSLESLDKSSSIVAGFNEMHKRYDLLRTQLWLDASRLKDNCDNDFNLIIYLYEYDAKDPEIVSLQMLYASITQEIKNNYREDVLLIPIAHNMDLNSLTMLVDSYGTELKTSIIVNNQFIISGETNYNEISQYLN